MDNLEYIVGGGIEGVTTRKDEIPVKFKGNINSSDIPFNEFIEEVVVETECLKQSSNLNIVDKWLQNRLNRKLDIEVFKLLNAATSDAFVSTHSFESQDIFKACAIMEQLSLVPKTILMHPALYATFKASNPTDLEKAYDVPRKGLFENMPVYTNSMCYKNCAFVLANKENLGVIESHDMVMTPLEEIQKCTLPNFAYKRAKSAKFAIMNKFAVVRIHVSTFSLPQP